MKQLKLMLTAIFAAFGRLFTFRAVQGGGGNFNFWRAFGAVCLSAILAIGNVAFAGNATFAIGERQATQATDGRIDIAYRYDHRDSYKGVSKTELDTKRGEDGWTYLHEVVARGKMRQIGELLRMRADTEIRTSTRGRTALHIAADTGNHDVVLMLLRARAHIEAWDKEGRTPLHLAAAAGHRYAVEVLVKKRANVHAQDKKGRTPLHLAVQTNASKLHTPVLPNAVMEWLIDRRADVNAKDDEGRTPLHLAAQANKIKSVRYLLENPRSKANKNAKDNAGRTALEVAVYAGSTFVAEKLIKEYKMDPWSIYYATKPDKMTPLHHAAKDNAKAVKTLLKLRAEIEARDVRGYTPLHIAALHNNAEAVRVLIAKGADVNALSNRKYKRQMPLHLAARHNATDAARELIQGEASPLYDDGEGKTPVSIAIHHHGFFSGIAYLMREEEHRIKCKIKGGFFCF